MPDEGFTTRPGEGWMARTARRFITRFACSRALPRSVGILAGAMIILVMGVCGAGKTTVGRLLAAALSFEFADADAFHPEANRVKMARGVPLDDDDRAPWLRALASSIDVWLLERRDVVLACSALKRSYRAMLLRDRERTRLVYLRGSPELIRERLDRRVGHFADSALLESQLAALEEPDDALIVDVAAPPEAIVQTLLGRLGR
jgi:gluconokinase